MKKLCICLENVMNIDGLEDFAKFLSSEDDLPIEVNFKYNAMYLEHFDMRISVKYSRTG